jgi:hypothetical protein
MGDKCAMCDKAVIQTAVKDALAEAHKDFWVDPETHYVHHVWVEKWTKVSDWVGKSFVKTFISGIVIGLFALIVLGAVAYVKIKGGSS